MAHVDLDKPPTSPEQVKLNAGSSGSWTDPDKLIEVFEGYKMREWAEELDVLSGMGGAEAAINGLRTNLATGLTEAEVQNTERLNKYGNNFPKEPERSTFLEFCLEAMKDLTMQILCGAGILSLILALTLSEHPEIEWMDGFAILVAVAIVVLVTGVNDYKKQQKFAALQEENQRRRKVTAIRNVNGEAKDTPFHPKFLVTGDVIKLTEGLLIPADGIIIESRDLYAVEAALTGENDNLQKEPYEACIKQKAHQEVIEAKQEAAGKSDVKEDKKHHVMSCCLLSGTQVASGAGKMVVCCVGGNSVEGRMTSLSENEDEETPLQRKLNSVANDISIIGLVCAIIAVVAMYIRFGAEIGSGTSEWTDEDGPSELVDFFIVGITVLVVAIPEGLPLAVTISLAYSVQKMQNDNNLVRRLHACETMGGADNICSDKTGTLTKNDMDVVNMFIGGTDYDFAANPALFTPDSTTKFLDDFNDMLHAAICLNSTADYTEFVADEDNPEPSSKAITKDGQGYDPMVKGQDFSIFFEPRGNPTELALLKWLVKSGKTFEYWRNMRKTESQKPGYRVFDFSSLRKRSSVVISKDPKGNALGIHVKGGAEQILRLCKYYYSTEFENLEMTPDRRKQTLDAIEEYARRGLRTICMAYRDIKEGEDIEARNQAGSPLVEEGDKDMTLIAAVAIQDPPKDGVKKAVEECREAYIRTRMVTGDAVLTAKAIAKSVSIITADGDPEYQVMEGAEFMTKIGDLIKICKHCRQQNCNCTDKVKKKRKEKVEKQKKKWEDECAKAKEKGEVEPDEPEYSDDEMDGIANIDELKKIEKHLDVLARSQPEHKYALVTGLRQLGHVVAVTGDGSNDKPALAKADIGFAMGIQGTDLAKEAAGIIILDDNFSSIVQAVVWGRNIYDNIRKFIQFQLTVNVVAVISAILCAAIIKQSPLTAVQMLWVNLIMDTLASLALATEPPDRAKLLDREPQSKTEYIVSQLMWKHIFFGALLQICVLFPMIFAGEHWIPNYDNDGTVENGRLYYYGGKKNYYDENDENPSEQFTVIFHTFVMFQLFNQFNARKIKDEINIFEQLTKSTLFLIIWVIEFLMQIFMVYVGGQFMKCNIGGLGAAQFFLCFGFSLLVLPWRLLLTKLPLERCMPDLNAKEEEAGGLLRARSLSNRESAARAGSLR